MKSRLGFVLGYARFSKAVSDLRQFWRDLIKIIFYCFKKMRHK